MTRDAIQEEYSELVRGHVCEPAVWTNGSALHQILLNLLTNARDAFVDAPEDLPYIVATACCGGEALEKTQSGREATRKVTITALGGNEQ